MTPLQFITSDCANHEPDGSCRGIMIAPDLSMRVCRPLTRCLVAEGKRCQYFEDCVAPLADWTSDPRLAASRQAAVAEYRRLTKQGQDLTRQCPDCGGPMKKRRRYCQECAAHRRKATFRISQSRTRSLAAGMSTVVAINDAEPPTNHGGIFAVSQNPIPDSHPPLNRPTTVDMALKKISLKEMKRSIVYSPNEA